MNTYYLKCDMGVVQIDWMDELIYGIGLPKKMKAKKSIPISAALKDTVKNLEKLYTPAKSPPGKNTIPARI